MSEQRERVVAVQVQQGEPKEKNPKLLPIGDDFGVLVILAQNTFFDDQSSSRKFVKRY